MRLMSPFLAVAPSTNDVPLWASLLVGIGIGTIVSSLMTLIGQGWQRRHELRLEQVRDLQRLRDARLERLREDLREVMHVASDLDEAIRDVAAYKASLEQGVAKVEAVVERFVTARSRLVLDPAGGGMTDAVTDLSVQARRLQGMMVRFNNLQLEEEDATRALTEIREGRAGFLVKIIELESEAQHLLQTVEEQPLYERPSWWLRLHRKGSAKRLPE